MSSRGLDFLLRVLYLMFVRLAGCVPKTPSAQVKRYVGTRGSLRRDGRVGVWRGVRSGRLREGGVAPWRGAAAARARWVRCRL